DVASAEVAHGGGDATERAVRDGMRVGSEDQGARKSVSFFGKDHVPDALAGVEFGDPLLLDPLARLLLGDRVLLPNRRIVMVEYDHDLRRREDPVAAHQAEEVSGACRSAVIEHDEVGSDVDDLPDLDTLAVGVRG